MPLKDKKSWKLKHPKQCQGCPWRKNSDLDQIKNYDRNLHIGLKDTIAENEGLDLEKPLHIMSCHLYQESHCIGWMHHQLNQGNNIFLRLHSLFCENIEELEVIGDQHESFEDTFGPNI